MGVDFFRLFTTRLLKQLLYIKINNKLYKKMSKITYLLIINLYLLL